VLVECYRLALLQFPTSATSAGALAAIAAADLPVVFGFLSLQDDRRGRQVVGVVDLCAGEGKGKDQVQVCRLLVVLQVLVDVFVVLRKAKELCSLKLSCKFGHPVQVVGVYNVAGNVEAEEPCHHCRRLDLQEVAVAVALEDLEVAVIGCLYRRAEPAKFRGVALARAGLAVLAGDHRRKRYGRNRAHFLVAGAD